MKSDFKLGHYQTGSGLTGQTVAWLLRVSKRIAHDCCIRNLVVSLIGDRGFLLSTPWER
jgi:hypothetical protein